MSIKTTVIGSWPKPDYLALPDWFNDKGNFKDGTSSKLTGMGGGYDPRSTNEARSEEMSKATEKAAKEIMGKQVKLGLDVITDGEVERGTYYIHVMNNIQGIDMVDLQEKMMRSGAYSTLVPAVKNKVHIVEPRCWKEWTRSNKLLPKGNSVLKYTIPGPMTILDGVKNMYYKTNRELEDDLAKAINKEILALVDHGCKVVQLDEPVLMRYPERALEYGIDNITKCFENVPAEITKIVHLCCGYPDKVDTDDYPKAPKENYRMLADKLDNAGFDQISIEDAEAQNDLSLLSLFKKSKIILGAVKIARTKVETVEEIQDRIKNALKFIPKDRLILAPDCGLGFLSEDLIRSKLKNMVEAARRLSEA